VDSPRAGADGSGAVSRCPAASDHLRIFWHMLASVLAGLGALFVLAVVLFSID
jgi:hypothetical protein